MVAAEAAVRNCEAMAADPLESRKGVMLLLAVGLVPPAGLAALRADEFAEPLVSRLSMMLEYSSRKFGNVKVSERTSSGPLPFLSAKKEFVELESLRGMVMSLLVSSASWLIICVTSHYKAGRKMMNPDNVKFPNLIVNKRRGKKGGRKGRILSKRT